MEGGFYNEGNVEIIDSAFLKNKALMGEGGGLYNKGDHTAFIRNSVLSGNSADNGGA